MAASLALFWLRFRKCSAPSAARVPRPISKSADGPRIRQFLWEVVAQGKVIGQRPLPGIAHALVFWGFCAFALATSTTSLRRSARAFFPVKPPWQVLSRVCGGVGRGGCGGHCEPVHSAAFFVRPVWLGSYRRNRRHRAPDLLLMAPPRRLWLSTVTLAGKAVWWSHTLALAIFLR